MKNQLIRRIIAVILTLILAASAVPVYAEDYDRDPFMERGCSEHSMYFCASSNFSSFLGRIVTVEAFFEWWEPLQAYRTLQDDVCLSNLVTFVEYFGITREEFQQHIDRYPLNVLRYWNLDVIFSGDWDLINQYFSRENERLHHQLILEHGLQFYANWLTDLQRTVNDNVSGRYSIHYHDIATFFFNGLRFTRIIRWMQALVDAGEYDRVNVVELVNYHGIPHTSFTRWFEEGNMHLFTHYNIDIIFSGDADLINRYYAAENEAYQTQQIRSRFYRHVAAYGPVDISWMINPIHITRQSNYTHPFVDVHLASHFYDPIGFLYQRGTVTGTSITPRLFSPGRPLTRAMAVQALYNLSGGPANAMMATGPFNDVRTGSWYHSAISWAADIGLLTGLTQNSAFRPNDPITRAHMAVLLYNYAQYTGSYLPAVQGLSPFSDDALIPVYAREAAEGMYRAGAVTAHTTASAYRFAPFGHISRAGFAEVLMRFILAAGL